VGSTANLVRRFLPTLHDVGGSDHRAATVAEMMDQAQQRLASDILDKGRVGILAVREIGGQPSASGPLLISTISFVSACFSLPVGNATPP
jgi:hypothetical protein